MVTQASSGITGKVAFDISIGSTGITLYDTSGTFNTTNTVSYTVSSTTYTVGVPSSPIKETDGMKFAWQGRTHIITDVTPIVTFTGLSSATGTVSAGATITQSSSGASGTLLFDTASSDTRLHLKDVTGTFLTGSGNPISGAGTGYPTAVVSTHTKYDYE